MEAALAMALRLALDRVARNTTTRKRVTLLALSTALGYVLAMKVSLVKHVIPTTALARLPALST
jgi:hypothetical protein